MASGEAFQAASALPKCIQQGFEAHRSNALDHIEAHPIHAWVGQGYGSSASMPGMRCTVISRLSRSIFWMNASSHRDEHIRPGLGADDEHIAGARLQDLSHRPDGHAFIADHGQVDQLVVVIFTLCQRWAVVSALRKGPGCATDRPLRGWNIPRRSSAALHACGRHFINFS